MTQNQRAPRGGRNEAEARALGQTLKCPTCQGQSIEDSNAEAAISLRRMVRDRLKEGVDPDQIVAELKAVYGDAISFDPPLSWETSLLWALPFLLILILGVKIFRTRVSKSFASFS